MFVEHAKEDAVARAQIAPSAPEEQDNVFEPDTLELFLDADGQYRWYEEGSATDVAEPTLRGAVAAGQRQWSNFMLVDVRGHVMETGEEVPDSHADSELEELRASDRQADYGAPPDAQGSRK